MLTLTRRQFPDRLMGADDLDAVTDLWLGWHHQERTFSLRNVVGYHRVQARLWGFPRGEGDRLQRLLAERVAAAGLADVTVERPDPDTLTATGPFLTIKQPCSLGLWLSACAGPEFDGLPLMLRLSIHDWRGAPQGEPVSGGTVVLCGRLQGGRFLLKGLWPAGLVDAAAERLYEKTIWPDEGRFLEALDAYRSTSTLPPSWGERFASRRVQKQVHWAACLLVDFPGQRHKLWAFLGRVAFWLALLALAAVLAFVLPPGLETALLAGFLAATALSSLTTVVWLKARRALGYYTSMRRALRKVYTQGVSFHKVDLAALGVLSDPTVVKFSRELEDRGCRPYVDIRSDPGPDGTSYTRIFLWPEEHTYVHLLLLLSTRQFQLFPAKPTLLLTTYFADGRRLSTANAGLGYRKQLNERVTVRYFMDCGDPEAMLDRHRRLLHRLLGEGQRLAPVMSPQGLLDRMVREHDEARELAERRGYYSWGDALRQTFDLPRREYLAD
jgi:hypothetical protein